MDIHRLILLLIGGWFMNVIFGKRRSILKAVMLIIFLFIVGTLTKSFGMQHYYKVDFSTGLVTATKLNVRSGPRNKL